jgi:hypothetical protein
MQLDGLFNTREIASAFWLLIFSVWALRKPDIRRAIYRIGQLFCHLKILLPIFLMSVYVWAIIAGLNAIGIWQADLLKDAIIWFCFGAVAMLARFVTADRPGNAFRETMADSLKVVIVVEFLVNTYTFSLAVEFVLVPTLMFFAILGFIAGTKEEFKAVSNILNGVQAILGMTILALAINRAWVDWHNLESLDTLRSIALAPILSVSLLPFLYLLVLYAKYEIVYVRLNIGPPMPPGLKRYAHMRIFMHAGLHLGRLENLLDGHMADLAFSRTESDVDKALLRAKRASIAEPQEAATTYSAD